MSIPSKIPLAELGQHISGKIDLFVCCASFEERSISLAAAIGSKRVGRAIFCVNEDYAAPARKSVARLKEIYPTNHELLSINTDKPLLAADRFSALLSGTQFTPNGTIFVDITTFTHEQLLILIRLLRDAPHRHRIFAGYTGASQYAIGLPDDQKWLSRGVDDIRSVLGYPGILVPSRKLHLIVLAGFESERAEKLIEAYDPAIISLGIGEQSASVSEQHRLTNSVFHNKLVALAKTISTIAGGVEQFQFSCVDPRSAQRTILDQAGKFQGYNAVVAPMNTKISTLGAAFAAFTDESLQICYAHPLSYNTENYSSPSTDCRMFDLTADLATTATV